MKLQIEYLPVTDLKPYDKNTRKHKKLDVDNIAKSIEKYGMNDAIGIWGEDNVIVEGHGRLEACKKLGIDTVPVVRLDHLTDEQRREYAIAHNATAELSEWDLDILPDELAELDLSDFDFDFGIEDKEEETEIVEDEAPEVDEDAEPIAKLGDIWQLGRHRLMCGDSTDKATVEMLMDGKKADMVMTDPPYNMHYDGAGIIKETVKNVRERIKNIVDFDPETIGFLAQSDIGSLYIFTSKDLIPKYFEIFKDWKFNILCWVKTNNPPMTHNVFLPDIEYLLYFHKGKRVWNNGLKPMDIYRKAYFSSRQEGQEEIGDVHPTMKPLKLLSDKITISSNKNGGVLDLFGGSGSTLIACEQLDRTCYMIELDPKYCDVIIKRWETLTGEKAQKIN
ncbi:MAG: DNA methyltransferase [Acutalibacteraceae bacterium]|nr:DNA methyltransferase [Acutalibacteraceae bacterium]